MVENNTICNLKWIDYRREMCSGSVKEFIKKLEVNKTPVTIQAMSSE